MRAEEKQAEVFVEAKQNALGFWHDKTPCWEMCHCPENIRNACPASKYTAYSCWEIEGTYLKLTNDGSNGNDTSICQVCRVYKRYSQGKPIKIKIFGKGIDAYIRNLSEKTLMSEYRASQGKEVKKMTYFMCQYCGYLLDLKLEETALPDKCPACAESGALVNVTAYTPEHGGEAKPDPKIMAYLFEGVENKRRARVGVAERSAAVRADSNAICYQAALIAMRKFRDQFGFRPVKKTTPPILVVEDEAVMRQSLRDWLVNSGYQVKTVEDGEKALETISEQDFGVAILDLRLPGKDGIEVLREAKERRPQLKGIIITAYPSIQTAVEAGKAGAIDYLPKPFDMNDLEKLIRQTLGPIQLEIKPTRVSVESKAKT